MREGSTRRRSTSPQSQAWTPERVQAQHWRQHHRLAVLRELFDGAPDLTWTRRLVNVLLDELHVTDEFDRFVGPFSRVPASQYPRLVALALLLRHSWSLHDLSRTGARMGLSVGPLEAELNTYGCDCGRRRNGITRTPLTGRRPH